MWLGGVTTGLTVGAEGVGTLGVAAGIVGVGVGMFDGVGVGVGVGVDDESFKISFISSNVNIG